MKRTSNQPLDIWTLYKMGGLTPALISVIKPSNAQHMAFIRHVMKQQRSVLPMNEALADLKAAVFDLETTGFHPNGGDEILSFGAVAVDGNRIVEEEIFYTLVNPGREIPSRIVELTGIDQESVADAPALRQGLTDFFEFVNRGS